MARHIEPRHNGHAEFGTREEVTNDLLDKHQRAGTMYKGAVLLFGALTLLGVIGFIGRVATSGASDFAAWGYYAAAFAFVLSTAQTAPMVAIAPRMAKAHWYRPISRAAEMWAVVGIFNLLVFSALLAVLPALDNGRRSMWFWFPDSDVPRFTPHVWATLAMIGFVVVGLFLLWVSSLPDLALIRDRARSGSLPQRIAARLSGRWAGASFQWFFQKHRMGILGAFYFMMLVFVHFLIVADFLMPHVPGWIDALFPATHAVNGLQAGIATVMLTMFVLRRFGGYDRYLGVDQFWGLGKLLFAISLLWVWFWFSSFIIFWYGRRPNEQFVLELFMVGPYLPIFFATFVMVFLVPLFTMIWNPVRKSVWGPPIVALSVLIGTFLDRIRLYVAAYSVPESNPEEFTFPVENVSTVVPSANLPDAFDVMILIGVISGSILIYLLASKVIPVVSIWAQRELRIYAAHRPFHRIGVRVLGKPD
ncbi:MAG: hypothetical protein L0177_14805 [Chloroflexi bacterium]|nr:hypothetical protein [Chloroflexota bacterium]